MWCKTHVLPLQFQYATSSSFWYFFFLLLFYCSYNFFFNRNCSFNFDCCIRFLVASFSFIFLENFNTKPKKNASSQHKVHVVWLVINIVLVNIVAYPCEIDVAPIRLSQIDYSTGYEIKCVHRIVKISYSTSHR